MNIKRFFSALLILTVVCTAASGCTAQTDSGKTPVGKSENTEADKIPVTVAESLEPVYISDLDYTADTNPCNENFALIKINGDGIVIGNYAEYNFTVTEHYSIWKRHNISETSKLYIPKEYIGKLKDDDTLLAMLTSFSDAEASLRGFTIGTNSGDLVCIPFEDGVAVGNEDNYPWMIWSEGSVDSNTLELWETSTPRGIAKRRADEYRKLNNIEKTEITSDMDIFEFMRTYRLKYFEKLEDVLPDFKIQNGTSVEKVKEYFDGMKKAKELENGFKASMKQEAAEILKVNLCI